MQGDALRSAVSQCPFLHRVSQSQGEGYALQIAANPFKTACPGATPPLLEDASSFESVVKMFHGAGGVVPLRRFSQGGTVTRGQAAREEADKQHQAGTLVQPAQPFHGSSERCVGEHSQKPVEDVSARCPPRYRRSLPMASMGLSAFGFLPDPGDIFGLGGRQRKPKPQRQQGAQHAKQQRSNPQRGSGPKGGPATNPPSSSKGGSAPSGRTTANPTTAARGHAAPGSNGAGATGRSGGKGLGAARQGAAGGGGQCPLRRYFGPLGGLLPLTAAGQLECPSAIVKMRAAVAALKPVRDLRPQALPVRALAMGATAITANLPCGMWREHTTKFSPEWFLAVHATIPFVAMLRKAVLMPKWAILLTLLGSVAGQQVGAQLERRRLAATTSHSVHSVQGPSPVCSTGVPPAPPPSTCRHRLRLRTRAGRREGVPVAAA